MTVSVVPRLDPRVDPETVSRFKEWVYSEFAGGLAEPQLNTGREAWAAVAGLKFEAKESWEQGTKVRKKSIQDESQKYSWVVKRTRSGRDSRKHLADEIIWWQVKGNRVFHKMVEDQDCEQVLEMSPGAGWWNPRPCHTHTHARTHRHKHTHTHTHTHTHIHRERTGETKYAVKKREQSDGQTGRKQASCVTRFRL